MTTTELKNAIRPFTVGRKNWLFCDSVKGAKSSTIIYSLASTAQSNGLNAEEYFTKILTSDKNDHYPAVKRCMIESA